MPSTQRSALPRAAPRKVWTTEQHGAWAMLLLPILLGMAASRPAPWQIVLAGTAASAYLASAALQTWSRIRRPPALRAPIVAYGCTSAVMGGALAMTFPALLLTLVVVVPAGAIVIHGAQPGTRRNLANSLAQVAQAVVLVPCAALVSGDFEIGRVVPYSLVAAAYLVGSVLAVRSVLRERGNEAFAAASVAFHLAIVVAAVASLPWAYAGVAAFLAARAAALPILQRHLAAGPSPLRPIHVGIGEIAASLAVVIVSFAAPL